MHLLTREAVATYARVLAPRGLLMVHISNRYLDLEPVIAAAAADGGWHAAFLGFRPDPQQVAELATGSDWIALTRDPEVLAALTRDNPSWRSLKLEPGFTAWTDDYSSILPLFDFLRGK
jgi:hypothetical protein